MLAPVRTLYYVMEDDKKHTGRGWRERERDHASKAMLQMR